MESLNHEITLSGVGIDAFCNFLAERAKGTECHISGDAVQGENVTFQDDSLCFDKVRPRTRKVNDFTVTGNQTYIGADGESHMRRVATRVRDYDDGYQRIQLMAVENPDYVYVHKFRDDLYKVVVMLEPPNPKHTSTGKEKSDDERFRENLARARIAIEEIALCNDWQYFVTLTIDGEKLSRNDLEAFRKKLQQMLRDLRRNSGTDIDYLFVPELHPNALKDGRTEWHLHGLMNLPEKYLIPFENRKKYGRGGNHFPPRYIREKVIAGNPVYYWKQYVASFGNSVLEPVKSRDASARYLMKYVSKSQGQTAEHLEKGQNLYYHSTGLKRAEKVPSDIWRDIKRRSTSGFEKHYENCIVYWYEL